MESTTWWVNVDDCRPPPSGISTIIMAHSTPFVKSYKNQHLNHLILDFKETSVEPLFVLCCFDSSNLCIGQKKTRQFEPPLQMMNFGSIYLNSMRHQSNPYSVTIWNPVPYSVLYSRWWYDTGRGVVALALSSLKQHTPVVDGGGLAFVLLREIF